MTPVHFVIEGEESGEGGAERGELGKEGADGGLCGTGKAAQRAVRIGSEKERKQGDGWPVRR